MVTAVITVAFDLIDAVQIGLLIAAFFTLRAVAGATSVHREPLPGVAHEGDERIALFRLDGAMFFGASDRILGEVRRSRTGPGVLRILRRTRGPALGRLGEALGRTHRRTTSPTACTSPSRW